MPYFKVAVLFDGLAGAFLASAAVLSFQGHAALAFGFLGPAVASIVGAIAFHRKGL